MLLIKNANLLSMADDKQVLTDILVDGKTISKIGILDINDYPNIQVIDAQEKLVTPGLVDGHCHVGMGEDAIGVEGDDINEMTSPIVPQVRAIDAIKPQDGAFKEALLSGITTVVTGPGSGEVISGIFCAMKTHGQSMLDMCIKEEVAMKLALGENPKRCFGNKDKMPQTRMGTAALMREYLIKAKRYDEKQKAYQQGKSTVQPEFDMVLDSLAKVYNGLRVKIHAHQQDDIVTAIRIGEEFGLNYSIEHCTEGYLIPNILKEKNVPIIIGPTLGTRTKYELRYKTFDAGKILLDNGVEFSIMTDHPVIPLENTLTQAAIFVKHGVNPTQVLKSLTILPAKMCGIDDQVGSIEVGKDADIVIWSGDPFHYLSTAETVIVNGTVVKQI
ncbi:MAG: amidohydrolase [Anaerorhabdus sp.]